MKYKPSYKQALRQEEIYLGYVNGRLCRFILWFDSTSHCYKKVV